MSDNQIPQPLTEQERLEVEKLFADFAANDPIATDTPQAEESTDEAVELPQPKAFFTKKRIAIFASILALLVIGAVLLFYLITPPVTPAFTTLSGGSCIFLAIHEDGRILTPSSEPTLNNHILTLMTKDVLAWRDIVSISAGTYHALGLKVDGTVVSTGFLKPDKIIDIVTSYVGPDRGQTNVSNWENITAVAAGTYHSVGLRSNGTVVAVGDNSCGQCEVSDWRDIIQIAAGQNHTVGLKKDGTVVCTQLSLSSGDDGQCNTETWTNIVAIAAGPWTTFGIRDDGTVVAAGANALGQCDVATWTDIIAIAAGQYQTLGLKKDGTVISTEIRQPLYISYIADYGQTKVSHWKDIVAVALTDQQAIGLKSDGTVVFAGLVTAEANESREWKNIRLP